MHHVRACATVNRWVPTGGTQKAEPAALRASGRDRLWSESAGSDSVLEAAHAPGRDARPTLDPPE